MLEKMKSRDRPEDGFTLVEILVVILIIGILASIAVPVFLNQRDKGMQASQQSGLRQIEQAIILAKVATGNSLFQITGNAISFGECLKENNSNVETLPKTDRCWVYYFAILKKISDASGMDISTLVDPYGRPYLINPNEGEIRATDCRTDFIGYYGREFVYQGPSFSKPMPMTTNACT